MPRKCYPRTLCLGCNCKCKLLLLFLARTRPCQFFKLYENYGVSTTVTASLPTLFFVDFSGVRLKRTPNSWIFEITNTIFASRNPNTNFHQKSVGKLAVCVIGFFGWVKKIHHHQSVSKLVVNPHGTSPGM